MNSCYTLNDPQELILWIDVETSGTISEIHELLEIGAVVTDMSGRVIGKPFESLINVNNLSEIIAKAPANVQKMHEESGLWMDLWNKECHALSEVENELIHWLETFVPYDSVLYFGGNSITLDRNFVRLNFPNFYRKISYRSVDVTSISIAVQSNSHIAGFSKGKAHRALPDAFDSLQEYKYYINILTYEK